MLSDSSQLALFLQIPTDFWLLKKAFMLQSLFQALFSALFSALPERISGEHLVGLGDFWQIFGPRNCGAFADPINVTTLRPENEGKMKGKVADVRRFSPGILSESALKSAIKIDFGRNCFFQRHVGHP